MNTSQGEKCFDVVILERLLHEQLHGEEEAGVLSHIERCDKCRDALAGLSGDGELGPELPQHFSADSFDRLAPTTVLGEHASVTNLEQLRALLAPTEDPQMLGRLGHYEVCGIVGQGSTGVVFKALDRRLNRYVAIKMLAPAYAGSGPARQRFEREGRSIAAVRDEHVIPVFAVDEHNGLPYIVMEYMPAGSLAQRIEKKGSLDTCEVTRIGMQIASALAAAHKQGIIHRDVKPANVLLGSGIDRALVTDFGLARIPDEASVTHSGAISGTPQFMSPEQAKGEPVDFRSDLFSLGSVMYMACTGHSPFRSETVFGVIKRVCETEPRPIQETNPQIDAWLCDFINKLHSKSPVTRFQSAEQVAELLSEELAYLQSPTSVEKPIRTWRETVQPKNTGRFPAIDWGNQRIAITAVAAMAMVAFAGFAWFGMFGRDKNNATSTASGVRMAGTAESEGGADIWTGPMKILDVEKLDVGAAEPWGIEASQALISREMSKIKSRMSAKETTGETIFAASKPANIEDKFDPYKSGIDAFHQREFREAIKLFREAIASGGYDGEPEYNIACAHALLKEADEAFYWLEKAANAGYDDFSHYQHDSDLDNIRKDERFNSLIAKLQEKQSIEKQIFQAIRLRESSQYEAANKVYREILNEDPGNEKAIVELGLSLHLAGDLDEAVKWHRKAAQGNAYKHYGTYNIACYYAMNQDADMALKYLAKAIEVGMDEIRLIERDSDLDFIRNDPRYDEQIDALADTLRKSWSKEEKACYNLIDAIQSEDYKSITLLLDHVDPNWSCPDYRSNMEYYYAPKQTPLKVASRLGNLKAVKLLIGAGANVKAQETWGKSALMLAAEGGHVPVAEFLLKSGAKVNRVIPGTGTALSAAAEAGQLNMMKFLLTAGAKPNSKVAGVGTPLICAAKVGQVPAMSLLLKNDADIDAQQPGVGTPLSNAARNGELEAMSFLLSEQVPLDTKVDGVGTALSVAIRGEQPKAVKLLLDAGAKVNAPVQGVGTPLSEAARVGDVVILQDLVRSDANLDGYAQGVGTALCVAAREGQLEAIRFLLDAGANPNGTSDDVGTPLVCAIKGKKPEAVKLLLKKGADPDRKSRGQKSARALAEAIGDDETLKLFKLSF